MPGDDATIWMWSEACRLLDRAESMHRRFYGIAGQAADYTWEPPADVYETDRELLIQIALPGVEVRRMQVSVEAGVLVVRGERDLPMVPDRAVIRRMELPYGRFERRIALVAGDYEFIRRQLVDGLLHLVLRKIA
ncbi:MAG TPA: Hsp20/alpha crystallin family protein [Candidatus Udaeobacter sp.]|nr:Hsp20/alpha crystallin family protein [Candidatus Udaeobacter sp.]